MTSVGIPKTSPSFEGFHTEMIFETRLLVPQKDAEKYGRSGSKIMVDWLVVWNINFMTFHSVGNVIIPIDELHHFSEG